MQLRHGAGVLPAGEVRHGAVVLQERGGGQSEVLCAALLLGYDPGQAGHSRQRTHKASGAHAGLFRAGAMHSELQGCLHGSRHLWCISLSVRQTSNASAASWSEVPLRWGLRTSPYLAQRRQCAPRCMTHAQVYCGAGQPQWAVRAILCIASMFRMGVRSPVRLAAEQASWRPLRRLWQFTVCRQPRIWTWQSRCLPGSPRVKRPARLNI